MFAPCHSTTGAATREGLGRAWESVVFCIEVSACQLCSVSESKPALHPEEISCCLLSSDSTAQHL